MVNDHLQGCLDPIQTKNEVISVIKHHEIMISSTHTRYSQEKILLNNNSHTYNILS